MPSLSQVGISSGTTIGSGQTWVPTRIPTYLNWNDFIYTSTNNDPFGIDGSPSYLDIRAQDNGSSSNGFGGRRTSDSAGALIRAGIFLAEQASAH